MLSNCHSVFVAVVMLSGNCVLFNTMDGSCMVVMFCDVIVAEISVSVIFSCGVVAVVVIFDRLFVVDISFWVVVAVCVVAVVVIGEVAVGVVVISVVIVFVDGAVVGVVGRVVAHAGQHQRGHVADRRGDQRARPWANRDRRPETRLAERPVARRSEALRPGGRGSRLARRGSAGRSRVVRVAAGNA